MTTTERTPALGGDEPSSANAPKSEGEAVWAYAYRQVLFGGVRIAPEPEWKLLVMRHEGDRIFIADLKSQAERYEVQPLYAHPAPEPVEGIREALEWYGEQARLARLIHSEGDAGRHALSADGGKRARAALQSGERS